MMTHEIIILSVGYGFYTLLWAFEIHGRLTNPDHWKMVPYRMGE